MICDWLAARHKRREEGAVVGLKKTEIRAARSLWRAAHPLILCMMLGIEGFWKVEVDVTPAMDGLTLFHCHQQLHMDYGFKMLFNVV